MSEGQLGLTGYNLNKAEGLGYGILLTGFFPFKDNRINLNLISGFRYSGKEGEPKKLKTNDVSVQTHYRMTKSWTFDLNLTKTYQDYIHNTIVDMGLSYRW